MLLDHATPAALNLRDHRGRTALHLAIGDGRLEAVLMLLAAPGVDVNCTDARMTTPLHWAAVSGHAPIIKVLSSVVF